MLFCVFLFLVTCRRGWSNSLLGWNVLPWGWGMLPCGWCYSLCGWSGLTCCWCYTHCDIGNSVCGRAHALCGRSDSQLPRDWGVSRLPPWWNTRRPLFDEWGNALSGGTINRKAPHTQIMPCIVANQHAAV